MTSYQDEIDLLDLWKAVRRRKGLVLVMTLVPGLLALAIAVFQPKVYVAEATIMPIRYQSDAAEVLAAGVAAQAGAMEALLGGFSSTKAPDLVGVLNSRALIERVVTAHQLGQSYKRVFAKGDVLDQVDEMVTVSPTNHSKTVTIRVEAPDPQLAAVIANAYVSELQGVLGEFASERAQKSRRVIEAQLLKTKQELANAEREMGQAGAGSPQNQGGGRWFAQQKVDTLKASYLTLLKQQEAASLAEEKGADDFLTLDEAQAPSKPQSSGGVVMVGIGLLIGLILGVAAAIYGERATFFAKVAEPRVRA